MRSLLALAFTLFLPALATGEPLIYVTNQANNSVHVLQPSDGLQVATIPVGQAPTGIALEHTGTFGYVANRGDNTVSRIDLATNTEANVIAVAGNPTAVAITPDGALAYVVQSTACTVPPAPTPSPGPTPTPGPSPSPTPTPAVICQVAAIDTASDTVIANIPVGAEPFDVAVSPSGGFAYVTNRGDDTISVIDTSTNVVIDVIPVGDTPEGVAVGGGELYVTNDTANTVTIIRELDLQIIGTIPVGAGPLGVAASPDGTVGVVSNDQGASVSVFATGTQLVTATVPVGSNPAGIAVFPDSTRAVVANTTGNSVTVFGLDGSAPSTYSVFGSPAEVAVAPEPNIRLSKGASPLPAPAGGTVTFSLVYTNVGTGPASNLVLTDPVPQHLTFVSASGGGSLVGTDVVWNIPALPAGGSGSATASFTVASPLPTGTSTSNTATLVDGASGQEVEATIPVPIDSNPTYDITASAPNPFVAGGQATYTITYSNLGTATSFGTQLVVDYDPALTFFSATPPPSVGDNVWNIGSLPPGAGGTITITVDIGSPLANGSTLTSEFTMDDAFNNETTAQAINTVQSAPQLALSITDVPDPAPANGIVLYDVVCSNPGTDAATGVVLDLAYDPALTFVGADKTPNTPAGTSFDIGTVPGGQSKRVRVQVRTPAIIPNGTVLSTTADVTDLLGNTANAAVDTTVQSSPALGLVIGDSPDPVLSGGQIVYTVTYSNTGGDVANGVALSVTYSPAIAFVSSTPAPDAGTNNVWTIGTLAAGASGMITIVVDAVAPNGSIATLTGVASDSASHSANAVASTVIDEIPALQVGIAGAPEPVRPGNLITYTLTFGNTGTEAATGVVLSAGLPAGATFVNATPPPDPGTTDQWTIGTLGIGDSGTVTVKALTNLNLTDGALLQAGATLEDGAGQLTTASTVNTIEAVQGIALATAAGTDPVPPGGQVTYTITYGNPGDTTLVDGILTMVYDPNLSFVSSTPPPASATNDFWLLGDILPGQGGTVQVTLDVDPGTPNGTVLASEAALSAASGEIASVAQLSAVETSPGLALTLSSAQSSTTPAGVVDLAIDYVNEGPSAVNDVVVTFDRGALSNVLSTTPAVANLQSPSWNVGTVGPGASGTLNVRVLAAAPAGGILTLRASATGTGQMRSATLHLPSIGSGAVTIAKAQYRKHHKKSKVQLQVILDELPPGFTGQEEIYVTFSTAAQLLTTLHFPPSSMNPKGNGWKGQVRTPEGAEYRIGLQPKKTGWRFRVETKELPFLPLSDSPDIRMSVSFGTTGFSVERHFTTKGPVTPTNQFLRYRGD